MEKKVVVISGATSGIGRATADKFSASGYDVWCLARREIENYPYHFTQCDVANVESIKQAVQTILSQVEKIDVLVCNAGIGLGGAMDSYESADVKRMFDVNFFGAYELAKAFMPKFKEQGGGRIVFLSSVGSIFALPFQGMYSATKCALEAMVYAWRAEVRPYNIQMGCVLPGDTKTNFTQERKNVYNKSSYSGRDEKSIEKMAKDEQNGMSPESVAKVIYRQATKRKMSPKKVVGFKYKLFAVLSKVLPLKFALWVVRKMYA